MPDLIKLYVMKFLFIFNWLAIIVKWWAENTAEIVKRHDGILTRMNVKG